MPNVKLRPLCSVQTCSRPNFTHHLCRGHWKRFLRYGDPLADIPLGSNGSGRPTAVKINGKWVEATIEAFFQSHISPDSEQTNLLDSIPCLMWNGPFDDDGYGIFTYDKVPWRAHRYALFRATGKNPKEMFGCHKCDNPPCVEEAHLYWGTSIQNIDDRSKRNRGVRGSKSPHAKLTEENVRLIKLRRQRNGTLISELAKDYGVSESAISGVLKKRSWTHVK